MINWFLRKFQRQRAADGDFEIASFIDEHGNLSCTETEFRDGRWIALETSTFSATKDTSKSHYLDITRKTENSDY